jgi:hypothetical protein
MNFSSTTLPPWSPPLHRTKHTLKKATNNSKVLYLIFTKLNKTLHLTVMCFSASTSIDGLAINGLILPVKAFTISFDHFVLILFLQREANCKCDNTDNNKNATKVCQELSSRASATGVHNLSGFEGSLPL